MVRRPALQPSQLAFQTKEPKVAKGIRHLKNEGQTERGREAGKGGMEGKKETLHPRPITRAEEDGMETSTWVKRDPIRSA
jgi:hypothetical protein